MVPEHAVVPAKLSNAADVRVTFALPRVSCGARTAVPPAGAMISAGFNSHSEAGGVAVPETTRRVMLYGANVCVELHGCEAEGVIDVELDSDSVYSVNVEGVKLFSAKETCAAFTGSPLTTMRVRFPLPVFSAANVANRLGSAL